MYLFRLDPRLSETFADKWLHEADLEKCYRPTDDEVAAINEKNPGV